MIHIFSRKRCALNAKLLLDDIVCKHCHKKLGFIYEIDGRQVVYIFKQYRRYKRKILERILYNNPYCKKYEITMQIKESA